MSLWRITGIRGLYTFVQNIISSSLVIPIRSRYGAIYNYINRGVDTYIEPDTIIAAKACKGLGRLEIPSGRLVLPTTYLIHQGFLSGFNSNRCRAMAEAACHHTLRG